MTGYVALLAPERVGPLLTAHVNVRVSKHSDGRSPIDAFTAAVQAWSEVVERSALTGEMDHLLRVLVRDMDHWSRFIMDSLLKHPALQDCKSSFMLRQLKGTTALRL